jgi:isoleucyl-tRNA synthetase
MKFLSGEQFSFPKTEEQVLEFWKATDAFRQSLRKRKGKKEFVFYEGPPTANGRPGIHHLIARAFKDVVCRFKTMEGFLVERKAGWDTHGLPVEIEVEKELGLKTKRDVEEYGIAQFNQKCKESVWKYKEEWERLTDRMGYWLDMSDPYITYQTPYIESLWYIIKQFWNKKLLYKGHKVVPWCHRCGTALSSHEMAQGYKTVKDQSVYVKFRIKNQKFENAFILSWTTTPWTLPGNIALAVGKDITYCKIATNGETYLLAAEALERLDKPNGVFSEHPVVLDRVKGKDLIGLSYEPLFRVKGLSNDAAYKVYDADFVTTTDGTGVVHTAVMYGEDDYKLGVAVGLPQKHTVDETGRFTADVGALSGMLVKSKDPQVTKETEEKIFEHLKANGNFLAIEPYEHEYPHCWRCQTPLIYYARDSWFVGVSKIRPKLLANNKKITWVPEHIKNGRFGEWLKEAKDWNFSRERYWGTPLPIWACEKCDHKEIVDSRDDIARRLGASNNRYISIRHGQATSNVQYVAATRPGEAHPLTLKGKIQVEKAAKEIKRKYKKIDIIITSDLTRTKETAEIIAKKLGAEHVKTDRRLREIDVGVFDGQGAHLYHTYYKNHLEKFTKRPPEGESLTDLRKRVVALVEELEAEHVGKTILLVSHEYPIWALYGGAMGLSDEETAALRVGKRVEDFVGNAEIFEIPFKRLPRDETGTANLHRPHIDGVTFRCPKCKGTMRRIKELADVWFDSGAMPFAQAHWPFPAQGRKSQAKNPSLKGVAFPADYICEAVDQTRGWFYTLLAVSALLGHEAPYRSAISLGHILDKNGEKMSKSRGNVVNPWEMMEKYGADAIRWHFYTVNPPGEPKRFDEQELKKTLNRFFLMLYNVFVFYRTYGRGDAPAKAPKPRHVLDQWIMARLDQTIRETTHGLETLDIGAAAKSIEALVEDLSRWYLRRSRRRLQKPESKADYKDASDTLGYVLRNAALLIAPFAPFFAESLFQDLGSGPAKKIASVHASDWPKARALSAGSKKLIAEMARVRVIAGDALKLRADAGIKVRQPLESLTIKDKSLKLGKQLIEILKEEINVKGVRADAKLETAYALDTTITPELKEEGVVRELIRMTQELRADAGYSPKDRVRIMIGGSNMLAGILQRNEAWYRSEVGAKKLELRAADKKEIEREIEIDGEKLIISLTRS